MIDQQALDKFEEDLRQEAIELLQNTAERTFYLSQLNLVENKWEIDSSKGFITTTITDTGQLLKTGTLQKTDDGAIVQYSIDYASDIEFGTPPGTQADFASIRKWVIRKLGVPKVNATQAAANIIKHIFEQGTDARPFLRQAVNQAVEEMNKKT